MCSSDLSGRRRAIPAPRATSAPGSPPPPSPHQRTDAPDLAAGRSDGALVGELIEGLIASYDLSTTEGQRARVLAALRRADVSLVQPQPGEPFDPSLHHALGAEAPNENAMAGRIARTERPGWRRGDDLVRYPEVVVWQ